MFQKTTVPVLQKNIVLATAFVLTSIDGFADVKSTSRLEETSVTASRVDRPLRRVGSSVSLLNSADIAARGQTTVAELLRSLPAIGVSNNGGLGKATTLRVRGEEGFRTKVLIDGVDVSDPSGTQVQPQIQHLLTADIERIEVLRGPQGMMYGADAGGVVNIITKKSDKAVQVGLTTEYGRYNSEQLAANIRGLVDDVDYSISVSDLSTDGFNARNSDSVLKDNDGYDNSTLALSVGYQLNQHIRIQALARNVEAESQFDGCFGPSGSTHQCDGEFEQSNYKTDIIFDSGAIEHRLSYAFAETERINYADNSNKTLDTEGELKQAQYLGSYALAELGQVIYGLDWEEQSINSNGNDNERDQTGLYLEWQGNFNNAFFYTAGVRHDNNDDFGEHTSYRLTGAYVITVNQTAEVKLKSSYGTGFRAPSLFEIAYNNSPAAAPPASLVTLEQEESKGFDIGVEYHAANGFFVELVYFNQDLDSEIDFDLSGFSGYLQESGRSESSGAELSFDLPVTTNFTFYGNYTYNETENADGDPRIRRPRNTANLGISYNALDSRIKINLNTRHVKDAVDEIFGIGQVALDDYDVLNANIAYAMLPELEVYVRGENLLDENYEEITGFNTAGAAIYGGFRYQF